METLKEIVNILKIIGISIAGVTFIVFMIKIAIEPEAKSKYLKLTKHLLMATIFITVSLSLVEIPKNYYGSSVSIVDNVQSETTIAELKDKDCQNRECVNVDGRCFVKEVESGEWYLLNENIFNAEIKEHQEIVNVEITNESEKPSVDIEKIGIIQTTRNQEIKYDFVIKNTGNVPLSDFTWYDYLPTDYVRITKLITGTYNQDLNYSIYYKTNKNDYKLLKDNLNTQVNNYIDFSNLELEADEYVTEFKADFGMVDVGFESVINPYIFVRVNSDVQNDDVFTNKTRIEGYNKTYMVWDEDDHTTKVYEKEIEVKKLPRTGI